ncbi:MAG: GTPase Era, partial [Acidiferrobacteraceae bacterium]
MPRKWQHRTNTWRGDKPSPGGAGCRSEGLSSPRRLLKVPFRSGFVAIMGRPNVGKSTLVNRLVGSKVSIVSPKPQTTRHRILGVRTDEGAQIIYIDTPGVQERADNVMNRIMNRTARTAAYDVDCAVIMITVDGWGHEDHLALAAARASKAPLVLVVNKIDRLARNDA